jgi:hypothetical protein
MTKSYLQYAVAAAFFAASGTTNFALAVDEDESKNNAFKPAQFLMVRDSDNNKIEVTGSIGVLSTSAAPVDDVDFYSFFGKAGQTIEIDIDHAAKKSVPGGTVRSLDAMIAVFHPTDGTVLRQATDTLPVDDGSISRFDPRLENVYLPVTGTYVVGVASDRRVFSTNGAITPFVTGSTSNGSYTLILKGVSPSAIQIEVDIKPGLDRITRINPKAKGTIPVALRSGNGFDALKADAGSIKFGPTGTEASGHCNKHKADLLCHFDMEAANFDESDTEGKVTGTIGGMPFEGTAWLKVIPVKKED